MINSVILFPAYGRKYHNKAQALADWQAGKDFRFDSSNGAYCSCRELDIAADIFTTYRFYTTQGIL